MRVTTKFAHMNGHWKAYNVLSIFKNILSIFKNILSSDLPTKYFTVSCLFTILVDGVVQLCKLYYSCRYCWGWNGLCPELFVCVDAVAMSHSNWVK